MTCKNCDYPLEASFIYCPECGQKSETRRLRLAEIINDFWTQFTDLDKGFFTLLRDLVLRPGVVAREYIAGKRRKHFGPLNFYLIMGTALILSVNVTEWIHAHDRAANENSGNAPSEERPSTGSVIETPAQTTPSIGEPTSEPSASDHDNPDNTATSSESRIPARREAVSHFWSQYSDVVSIAAAPFICLFFWLFYRHIGFNYTELLVACLYMIGFTDLVYALVFSPLTAVVSSSSTTTYVMTGIFKLFEIGYFTYFYFQLAQGKIRRPLLRAALSSMLVAIFWTVLNIALVAFYMRTGFGLD